MRAMIAIFSDSILGNTANDTARRPYSITRPHFGCGNPSYQWFQHHTFEVQATTH